MPWGKARRNRETASVRDPDGQSVPMKAQGTGRLDAAGPAISLAEFADADGNPEGFRMLRVGRWLLVSLQRLDNFLLRELKGVPKTHVYRVIRSGEVRVNKGRAGADTRVAAGDGIERRAGTVPVGTTCRLCVREACRQRQEPPLVV